MPLQSDVKKQQKKEIKVLLENGHCHQGQNDIRPVWSSHSSCIFDGL
jgi:hypothetical protein